MVINPYTFLPVSDDVERSAPNGHRLLGQGRYSGSFSLTLTARTPMLLGPLIGGGQMPPTDAAEETVIIPGSSLAGAIRAIHEAMNNSCLRIIDGGYRAVHRHAASPQLLQETENGTLRMAIITHVTPAGLPDRVALCDRVVWVPVDRFTMTPRTGMRVDLPDDPATTQPAQRGPRLAARAHDVSEDARGRWFILVTDVKPRANHPVYFACGRLARPVEQVQVPERAQAALARAIETSSELHGINVTQTGYVNVERHGYLLGRKLALGHDGESMGPIPVGTPVWVKTEVAGGARFVSEIRMSLAWRRTSKIRAIDRVPPTLRPCQDPARLCPTCRLFGSAGADDNVDEGPTSQNSYRGHVRFVDARASTPPQRETFTRAPLLSPKPTAGQFYLDNQRAEGSMHPHVPTAQWDSTADGNGPRPIRGRKFYWRTRQGGNLPAPQHRGRHFGTRNAAQTQEVTVLAEGSSFTTRVAFDNLSLIEIGSLLAAASPHRVLGAERVLTVGGGRPFGWGAVRGVISDFSAAGPRSRYTGTGEDLLPSAEDCLTAYQDDMAQRSAAQQWPILARLLTVNPPGVADAHVWYPPNPDAGKPGITRGTKNYDEGFGFWQGTNGFQFEKKKDTPLQSLPHAGRPDQNIPVV